MLKLLLFSTTLFLFPDSVASSESEVRDIQFKSQDGFVISGRFHPAAQQGPGILLLHQCDRKTKAPTGYERLGAMLAKDGLNALEIDLRGYGKSTSEKYNVEDWREASPDDEQALSYWRRVHPLFGADVEAAYQFLTSQPEVVKESVGVVGASCGARHAINLAAKHVEVGTLVLISGAIGKRSASNYQKLLGLPVLCVVSDEDPVGQTIIRSMQDAFAQSQNRATRLVVYKAPYHGTPLFDHDDNLESQIVRWLREKLTLERNPSVR